MIEAQRTCPTRQAYMSHYILDRFNVPTDDLERRIHPETVRAATQAVLDNLPDHMAELEYIRIVRSTVDFEPKDTAIRFAVRHALRLSEVGALVSDEEYFDGIVPTTYIHGETSMNNEA